ncbi:MAG: hypothetical protein KBD46_01720 [Candidatus Levybacteria bacterium]|nr:hypothetical protein [Candidatus Levybacteria bacterium]
MEPKNLGDHQKLLTEVIKKQIVILGPDITLAKARNVAGLTIADDGTVTAMTGDPKLLTQQLVNQFMELSGLIVKKTMEPLLASSMDSDDSAKAAVAAVVTAPVTPTPPVVTPTPPSAPTPNAASPIANSNPDVQQSEKQA